MIAVAVAAVLCWALVRHTLLVVIVLMLVGTFALLVGAIGAVLVALIAICEAILTFVLTLQQRSK